MRKVSEDINKDFSMIRGDTLTFGVQIMGAKRDLDTAYFTCKEQKDSPTIVFQKSLDDGITKINTGKYRCRISPEDTKDLFPKIYYYDMQVSIGDDVKTILMGRLDIEQDVT